jgi:hypothetical protein
MSREAPLTAATRYLARHPGEVARVLRSLIGLRIGVPLDAFRWMAEQAEASGKAQDVTIDAVPPGVRIGATIDLMGTVVRASSVVFVDRMVVDGERLQLDVRLDGVNLSLVEDSDSPVAMLIKSGALDLSKPGNLVKHVPNLPPVVVSAADDRIVLDLMRHPKIGGEERARNLVTLVTSVLTIHGVETDERHFDVTLRAFQGGLFNAARQVRRHVVLPSIRRARLLLPGVAGGRR